MIEIPRPMESADKFSVDTLVEQSAVKIADQYGHVVNEVMDNAALNDIVLRAAIKLPLGIQESPALFRDFLHRISSRTNAVLGKRGVQPEDRSVFADRMKGLESSVYQMTKFVRAGRAKNPDFRFATSVWIDVFYGYDLLRAWPVWVPERQGLDVFITGYQAKASRDGLEPAEVRGLPDKYRGQKARAARELEFDPDWVMERILSEADPLIRHNTDRALRGDDEQARRFIWSSSTDAGSPFERWYAQYQRERFAGREAALPGLASASMPPIHQRGQEVNMRFIVDTKKGTEDLTEEQARTYGIKAA